MDYALVRGKTLDEIVEAYRAVSAADREVARAGGPAIQPAFQKPYRCPLQPGPTGLQASTLQRSAWTFKRENQDYGDSWYLVVRALRTWAPDSITDQNFAVSVTLEGDEPQLYALVRSRIQVRLQQRARTRV